MDKNENQRVRLTKRLLRESLMQLLRTRAIHTISVRELCQCAGINRSTFYKYYGSPYEILAELESDVLARIMEIAPMPCDNPAFAESYINEQLVQIMHFLDQNAELCRLLTNSVVNPDFPQRLLHLPAIHEAVNAMVGRGFPAADAEYLYAGVVQACYSIASRWIHQDVRESPDAIARLLGPFIHLLFTFEQP